ncbi:HK97 gp10 family phage protein [Erwinia tracheiphila]|uniref:HK97 gp10 family phage protein n=1 Tax=Erwinia tracheiphila TaxID=65700 RepID=A0A345CRI7_9GAMM|nr:HK97 gp10 family phage protein [Erwinia tracheiphila]AXF76054.1 HK97 gp10 family phage protein [Erwinia tracheiphila]UIA85284.1 HK97 gp10 family phage protein [Erwinia tracheiphila]
MGVRVRGIQQAKRNLDKVVDDIQGRKAVRAIVSAFSIIGPLSAVRTPVGKTSVLINSLFQNITTDGARITGRIGYSANYALYVHEASGVLKGKSRPASQGGGRYWDPSGEPNFLSRAAKETRDQVDAVIRKEMLL